MPGRGSGCGPGSAFYCNGTFRNSSLVLHFLVHDSEGDSDS